MAGPIKEVEGQLRDVWWADARAMKTLHDSLAHCPKAKQEVAVKSQIDVLLRKIANHKLYSRLGIQKFSFPEEGELPSRPGRNAKKYYAIKKPPVRVYGWFYEGTDHPEIRRGDFIISHCVHKDYNKKKSVEDERIANKWRILETK